MKDKIVLLGAGPLGVNAAHIIQQQGIFEIAGFVDTKGGIVAGYNVLGDDSVLDALQRNGMLGTFKKDPNSMMLVPSKKVKWQTPTSG